MKHITTLDGTSLYVKDWGAGRPVFFSHGWPLDADAWDEVMFAVAAAGYRASPMTDADTAAPTSPRVVTTWIPTPTTWPRSSRRSTRATPYSSGIRPAGARWCAISPGTAQTESTPRSWWARSRH
jgi:hypothetical protein